MDGRNPAGLGDRVVIEVRDVIIGAGAKTDIAGNTQPRPVHAEQAGIRDAGHQSADLPSFGLGGAAIDDEDAKPVGPDRLLGQAI